jgi:hypothetical protein
LLRAVRRVLGHIDVERHASGAPLAPPMARDHHVGQGLAEPVERPRAQRVFEARDGRLRGQARAADRVAVKEQLLNRIVGQSVGIIRIGIAARDRKDALRQHVGPRMRHARRRPPVAQHGRQRRGEPQCAIRGFEQDRTTIRARVRLIKRRDEGLLEEIGEEDSLWYRVVCQRERLRGEKHCVATAFYHAEAFVFVLIDHRS